MDVRETLHAFGLKPKAADLYLALLAHPSRSVQQLAQDTGLLRQVVYDAMRDLLALGLATGVQEGRAVRYVAAEPQQLLTVLQERQANILAALPTLRQIRAPQQTTPRVTASNDLAGIKAMLYETLDAKESLLWISNYAACHAILQEHIFYNYTIKRIERKVPLRIIVETGGVRREERDIWKTDVRSLRTTREHTAVRDIPATYIVFGDTVLILTMDIRAPHAIRIQDAGIARSQRAFFEMLWSSGKEFR
jgi:sugar-specific transcriptional regulator TrmB